MTDTTRALTDDTVAGLLADTEPYLSCDDCFERMDEYVERRVTGTAQDDPEMAAHLAGCGVCAEEAQALEDLLREDDER